MSALLRLDPGAPVLAFDVGGTDVKAATVAPDGVMSTPTRVPTPRPSPRIVADVLELLARTADDVADRAAVAAVGLALPGIVDDDAGVAVASENLCWEDVPFRDLLAERLGVPVTLTHDVRAAAFAELRVGAARDLRDALIMTVGTGIAAGVVIDGRVIVREGFAGEIGHAVVRPGGEACMCGNRGCLEATASAAAIARRYSRATGTPVAGAREVLARVGADPAAREIWDDAVDALAFGLSHVCAALAPEAIVIAGGLSEAGDALLAPLQERLDAYFPMRSTPLMKARLGGDAGVVGAALRARELAEGARR